MTHVDDRIPQSMPTSNRPRNAGVAINDDASRLDAVAKVTGQAKYGRDRCFQDGLWVAFIRCPFGQAELDTADVDAARAVPGVVEVELTGDRGRYHGHAVGHVVAESKLALQRGLKALKPFWQRDSVNTEITDEAPDLPEASEQTQQILADADHVLEAVYSTPVQTHSALETHGASIEHRGDEARVYASTQGTFSFRDGLDEALELPSSQFEVICEYIGGGFGAKLGGPGKEGQLAAQIAAKYKRPAYLFVDRAEEHLDTGNRPSSRTHVRVGFNNDGTILGGQIHTFGGVGVGRRGGGCNIPSRRYDYNLRQIQRGHNDVSLNAGAPRAMRAPGHPQGAFAEELMLDEIATIAGVDPLDLRLRLESDDDRRAMFEQGAQIIGWSDRQATGSQTGVVRRGFGMGAASWGRFPSNTECEVVINRDGSIEARTGTQDIGTGQRTVMGIVASDTLGVPLDAVQVRIGHSRLPEGPASGGSVTAHNSAPAMQRAAVDAREKLLTALADKAGADASEFDIAEGEVRRNGEAFASWRDACQSLPRESIVGRGTWNRGDVGADQTQGHSNGVQFVDLSVDTETGVITLDRIIAIQACGRVICRKTAESQIIGGVVQGISYALFEHKILDRNAGAMVNPNFEWYKVAGTRDMPHIEPILWRRGQTGVRSLGEPPTIPTAGAIACALFNAIGAPVRHLPLTPDKVLAAAAGGEA